VIFKVRESRTFECPRCQAGVTTRFEDWTPRFNTWYHHGVRRIDISQLPADAG
jgi:hypothetical protein